ncbi:T9SS type A sorting domain-containing protein [Hymenobacter latericus]|uniref:T9SS type A sorting domain-containing protein n=1 Tax=Hymenobacter sp. YIM 151858-1 TaxID=2987688 RepID=UPI00222627CA|nr:T9SS type A sorting domain-containing protein [Hymenobacter sp. YIM 151858-1]UYZ60538.1 T9SS type A sorting domain-containing protein [Hymenobacter sp. YIM 151858-1]
MKQLLLSLAGAMLACTAALGQGSTPFWIAQNFGANAVPANHIVEQVTAVNASTVWVLLSENAEDALVNRYARSTDGGNTWTGGQLTGLPAGLSVANISAVDANTAWVAAFAATETATAPGIYKTTNGGQSWTRQATATFSGDDAYPNVVHFFDANQGVAFGDPNPGGAGAQFEIYTTANGGTTWTRVSNAPTSASATEYGMTGSYFVLGNTIWLSTLGSNNAGARLLKSTDRGATWAAYNTPITGAILNIAFTDAQRGLLNTGFSLASTTDGGATSSTLNYTGPLRVFGLDAVPGLPNTYISVGQNVRQASSINDFGSSISRDGGQTWTNMDIGKYQFEIDMLSPSIGYTGGFTGEAGSASTGGMFKLNSVISSTRVSVATDAAVKAFPNPSASGLFQLSLGEPNLRVRRLQVADALGREVYSATLQPTAATSQEVLIDLSQHKAGLYNLQVETNKGTLVRKLVIR